MKKILFPIRVIPFTVALTLLTGSGCIETEKTTDLQAPHQQQLAACDQCHDFPGSLLCKATTLEVDGKVRTHCSACHEGAVTVDSSRDAASQLFRYFDAMMSDAHPTTGPAHTDGQISLGFTQCTFCHSYPPTEGLHRKHVVDEAKSCFECHFTTAAADTLRSGDEVFFTPRMRPAPGGGEIPQVNASHHINGAVEVTFRRKMQLPAVPDSLYGWNRVQRSCSNIACHGGAPDGASVELTFWDHEGDDR